MCCLQGRAFQGAAPASTMAKEEAGRGCSLDLCPTTPPTPNGQTKARKQFGDHPPTPGLGTEVCVAHAHFLFLVDGEKSALVARSRLRLLLLWLLLWLARAQWAITVFSPDTAGAFKP